MGASRASRFSAFNLYAHADLTVAASDLINRFQVIATSCNSFELLCLPLNYQYIRGYMYLLGYDIGSDRIRAALIDAKRKSVVYTAQYPEQEMNIITRQSGWAEQQPEWWWYNFCTLTRKLIA